MPRRLLNALCVLLLLATQQVSLLHAAWHAGVGAPATYGFNGHATTQDAGGKKAPAGQERLCAFDLAFGLVLGGSHGTCTPLTFVSTPAERIHDLPVPRLHAEAVSPRSRGPPVLH